MDYFRLYYKWLLLLLTDSLMPVIRGPDYVTVGVPSSVECDADCQACSYSMSLVGQTAHGQGNSLVFTLSKYTEGLTVSCTVTNEQGHSATTTKKLQVLVGPVNVSISGDTDSTDLFNPSVSHIYNCHAHCRPSCSYLWKLGSGPWVTGQGNVLSLTPTEMNSSKILICKATNTVSGMFTAATKDISDNSDPDNAVAHLRSSAVLLLLVIITILTTM